MPYISIVSPVYKVEKTIKKMVERVEKNVVNISDDYEIILVEDFSPDNSWSEIIKVAKQNKKIKGLKLSRNFGQHYAISAGLRHAKGDWIIVMDCDLQDRPEEFTKLYNKVKEGYDLVLARRVIRKDSFFKKVFSKVFYAILSYLSGRKQDPSIANFGIYSSKAIQVLNSMNESIRYFPTMISWIGFASAKIDVEHAEREEGKSSYNFARLFNLAIDIILANSDKPIKMLIKSGFLVSSLSVAFAVYYFIKWFNGDTVVLGYSSLIISIWLLSGFIISTLGVIGLYLGKVFEQVKNRPLYIIDKSINIQEFES